MRPTVNELPRALAADAAELLSQAFLDYPGLLPSARAGLPPAGD